MMRRTTLSPSLWPVIAAFALFLPGPVRAGALRFTVSGLQLSSTRVNPSNPLTVSYSLTGSGFNVPGGLQRVEVSFLSGETVVKALKIYPGDAGARRGLNALWIAPEDMPAPGEYRVHVAAYGVGVTAPDYVRVSDPADPGMQFAAGRGVDVNRVTGSPYLGRVYVTEGAGGAAANRTTVDGVYVLNPDQSPAFATARATSSMIGALGPWAASANSPNRPVVGDDGKVYITDVSDAHSAVFVADPDLATVSPLFAYPYPSGGSRDGAGVVKDSGGYVLYGSTSSIWVEGSGTTRTVFTTDEDVPPGNSIWKRQIPAGATGTGVRPALYATPAGADWVADLVRDSAGNTYAVSLTANDARKFGPAGNLLRTLPLNGAGCYGICIDEAANTILLATNDGRILKTDTDFYTSSVLWNGIGTEVRDVAMDADRWIYELNGTDRRLEILAIGDFATSGTSVDSAQTVTVEARPVPGDIAPVGPGGRNTGPNGLPYGDGAVDIRDALYLLQMLVGTGIAP